MKSKTVKWIILCVIASLLICASVLLPIFLLKSNEQNKVNKVDAGVAPSKLYQVQLHVYVYNYFLFFRGPSSTMIPFATDSSGKAFDIDLATNKMTSISGVQSSRLWTYISTSTQSAFAPGVTIAKETYINSNIIDFVSSTQRSRGSFYLSDDGKKIMVGYIDASGKLIPRGLTLGPLADYVSVML